MQAEANRLQFTVTKSSWLMPIGAAVFLGLLAAFLAVLPFLLPDVGPPVILLTTLLVLVIGALVAYCLRVGLRTRHCHAVLSADRLELTSFQLLEGRGTRRLVSAWVPWTQVQSLSTESYDLVSLAGWRMELRNLFVFTQQGDFVLYGYAWQDWQSLVAGIVERSGRALNVPAAERAGDVAKLRRHVRRNVGALRVMTWIGLALMSLILFAGLVESCTARAEQPMESQR